MNKKKTLAAMAGGVLAVGAISGLALATPAIAAPASHVSTVSVAKAGDTDSLQQGDQTTTDVAGTTANETPGETSSESAPSDGPGGHADPAGDVQHQGGANEQ